METLKYFIYMALRGLAKGLSESGYYDTPSNVIFHPSKSNAILSESPNIDSLSISAFSIALVASFLVMAVCQCLTKFHVG